MVDIFNIEKPQDTDDDRVTFIIKFNGTVLPGFISRSALVTLGGDGNLIQLFNKHYLRIEEAVRKKLPAPMTQYISLSSDDFR